MQSSICSYRNQDGLAYPQISHIEGTVLLHFSFAIKQDHVRHDSCIDRENISHLLWLSCAGISFGAS